MAKRVSKKKPVKPVSVPAKSRKKQAVTKPDVLNDYNPDDPTGLGEPAGEYFLRVADFNNLTKKKKEGRTCKLAYLIEFAPHLLKRFFHAVHMGASGAAAAGAYLTITPRQWAEWKRRGEEAAGDESNPFYAFYKAYVCSYLSARASAEMKVHTRQALDWLRTFARSTEVVMLDEKGNPVYHEDESGQPIIDNEGQPIPVTDTIQGWDAQQLQIEGGGGTVNVNQNLQLPIFNGRLQLDNNLFKDAMGSLAEIGLIKFTGQNMPTDTAAKIKAGIKQVDPLLGPNIWADDPAEAGQPSSPVDDPEESLEELAYDTEEETQQPIDPNADVF